MATGPRVPGPRAISGLVIVIMGARRVVVPVVVAAILLVASTASTTRSIEAANRSRDRRARGGHPGSWTQGRGQVVSSRMLGEEEIVELRYNLQFGFMRRQVTYRCNQQQMRGTSHIVIPTQN